MKIFAEDIVQRVLRDMTVFQYEAILLELFELCTDDQADKSLREKVEYYHTCWGYTLLNLYKDYLPHETQEGINIKFEITPFTHFLASEFAEDITGKFNLKDEDLLFIKNVYYSIELEERLLPPENNSTNYVLQIMLFPPLMQLSAFYSKAFQWHAQSAKLLLNTVMSNDVEMPKYETNLALYLANRFISQEIYRTMGEMDGLINSPELAPIAAELLELKTSIPTSMQIAPDLICPRCGVVHGDVSLAHLTNTHSDLHIRVGFYLYESYRRLVCSTHQ